VSWGLSFFGTALRRKWLLPVKASHLFLAASALPYVTIVANRAHISAPGAYFVYCLAGAPKMFSVMTVFLPKVLLVLRHGLRISQSQPRASVRLREISESQSLLSCPFWWHWSYVCFCSSVRIFSFEIDTSSRLCIVRITS